MSYGALHLHLDAYLGVRQALGFQMRAERTLLRDFVSYIETHADVGPIRAQLAVDWACALSAQRGASGAAQRLSMARGFLTYLRALIPETEVPDSGLVMAFRRPKPYLLTPVVLKNSAGLIAGLLPAWCILSDVMSSCLNT